MYSSHSMKLNIRRRCGHERRVADDAHTVILNPNERNVVEYSRTLSNGTCRMNSAQSVQFLAQISKLRHFRTKSASAGISRNLSRTCPFPAMRLRPRSDVRLSAGPFAVHIGVDVVGGRHIGSYCIIANPFNINPFRKSVDLR